MTNQKKIRTFFFSILIVLLAVSSGIIDGRETAVIERSESGNEAED